LSGGFFTEIFQIPGSDPGSSGSIFLLSGDAFLGSLLNGDGNTIDVLNGGFGSGTPGVELILVDVLTGEETVYTFSG